MNLSPNIDLAPIVAALRPLERLHVTLYGEKKGFFMTDATRALGGLAKASEAIAALMLADMLDGDAVVIEGDDAHTLYRLTDAPQSAMH
jgi:hypothetical protein